MLEVQNGAENSITKIGKPAVAAIDAKKLNYYHRLDRARIQLLLLNEVTRGLADMKVGRTVDALEGLAVCKAKRKSDARRALG